MKKPKQEDILLFWTYLHHFLKAGLPLLSSFEPLKKVLTARPWPLLFDHIESHLRKGMKLSQCLSSISFFSQESIEMMRIGEEKGNYPFLIAMIIQSEKWRWEIRKSLQNALRYPLILLGMGGILFALIVGFMIPQLELYFKSFGLTELPLATRALIKLSMILPPVLGIIFLGFGIGFLIRTYRPHSGISLWIDRHLAWIPLWGSAACRLSLLTFVRIFAVLSHAQVDVLVRLHHTCSVVPNLWHAYNIERAKKHLISGLPLSQALSPLLKADPILQSLFELGETTGELAEILTDYSTFAMSRFHQDIDRRIQTLQPLLILILGGFLSWVVAATLLPLYQTFEQIGPQ